jgi:hypothetical protein
LFKSPNDIASNLRSLLPNEQKEASWGYLAEQFPWYPTIHLLRAAQHQQDWDLLQKAALYHPDLLRLNVWLQQTTVATEQIAVKTDTKITLQKQDPLEELIPLTPYHTIDYFASQGIKVEKIAATEAQTQLDTQVKSFTEWLKTMKRLKFQPATSYSDPLVDAKAKASVHKKEVVTEAMAEVWAKQGDFDHAAQVYAKLMLLHPEKTPYFAARLQELKEKQ